MCMNFFSMFQSSQSWTCWQYTWNNKRIRLHPFCLHFTEKSQIFFTEPLQTYPLIIAFHDSIFRSRILSNTGRASTRLRLRLLTYMTTTLFNKYTFCSNLSISMWLWTLLPSVMAFSTVHSCKRESQVFEWRGIPCWRVPCKIPSSFALVAQDVLFRCVDSAL